MSSHILGFEEYNYYCCRLGFLQLLNRKRVYASNDAVDPLRMIVDKLPPCGRSTFSGGIRLVHRQYSRVATPSSAARLSRISVRASFACCFDGMHLSNSVTRPKISLASSSRPLSTSHRGDSGIRSVVLYPALSETEHHGSSRRVLKREQTSDSLF